MRKRNIKTVAHWVIMCFILLFPILMVGISAFAHDEQSVTVTETYEYETNVVNSVDDLVVGNIYSFDLYALCDDFAYNALSTDYLELNIVKNNGCAIDFNEMTFNETLYEEPTDDKTVIYLSDDSIIIDIYSMNSYIDFSSTLDGRFEYIFAEVADVNAVVLDYSLTNANVANFLEDIQISDYLGEVTTNVDIQNSNYKQEVNNWANSFKNLPVNQWYGQLLDVCGVGQTTNSVMNVMYVYPLYVLWVYLLDLILDCLLVIVNLGHNALKRLDSGVE